MLDFFEERQFLSTIKNVEKHDKNRNTVSAKEILDLSQKRFILMQDILGPLRDELSKYLEIENMYYDLDVQNNVGIYVAFKENDNEYFLIISQYNLDDDIEISYDSSLGNHSKFVMDNKDKVMKAFELGINHNFEQKFDITSTSKSFVIRNNCILMELMNKSRRNYFDIQHNFSYPNGQMHVVRSLNCVYPNILKCLKDNEANLDSFMNHVRVYEEKVKYLTKK